MLVRDRVHVLSLALSRLDMFIISLLLSSISYNLYTRMQTRSSQLLVHNKRNCIFVVFMIHLQWSMFLLFHIWRCKICSCGTIVFAMASFLLPLSTAEVAAYHNVESLVDVAVQHNDGTTDIITFDSMLLPWHFRDSFLEQFSCGRTMRMCYPCQVMELGMGRFQGQRQ